MKLEIQYRVHKDALIILILSWIHPIFHINTNFFTVQSNIAFPSTSKNFYRSLGLPVKILKVYLLEDYSRFQNPLIPFH